jgi:hypothetical protein
LLLHLLLLLRCCRMVCVPQEVTLQQTSPGKFVVDLKAAALYS